LEPGTDLQTFTFSISSKFRNLYDKIYQPIAVVSWCASNIQSYD